MKKLIQLTLCLGLLALASCRRKEKPADDASQSHQQELQQWQARAESEFQKRQEAESEVITASARARSLEKAVLATGVAAVGFLLLGGAMGSKAKKDALKS